MKIFNENKLSDILKGHNAVCLDTEIKRIVQHLSSIGQVTSDGDLVLRELRQAQEILDRLIIGMHDESPLIVYPNGSSDDFLDVVSEIKKENIDIICDNDSDERLINRIMGLPSSASHEEQEEAPMEISEIAIHRRN